MAHSNRAQRNDFMDQHTHALFEAQAAVIKAMAHPTRLFVVDQLSHGEKCVCELTEMIGADVSTVSKHLSILKNAGIVKDDKRGTQVFYTLEMPCVLNFFSCVRSVIETRAKDQMKLIR
jgi:DNA-binding transcriptional ArsR family regulator